MASCISCTKTTKRKKMDRAALIAQIKEKKSFLCVGLDTDIDKIPEFLRKEKDPLAVFNKAIIDATHDLCVAYKPNIAFYECYGIAGWQALEQTVQHIPSGIFTIADGKRGDIGNTSRYYAQTFFDTYGFHSLTVAPYMGRDSVEPFLEYDGKWAIVLGLTSNAGANDFQLHKSAKGEYFFEKVVQKCSEWGTPENLMFVVGATRSSDIALVRKWAPDHFFLVPGVGAQGGSLQEVVRYGWNKDCGLLVNASRSILYASSGKDFQEKARAAALDLQRDMEEILTQNGFI